MRNYHLLSAICKRTQPAIDGHELPLLSVYLRSFSLTEIQNEEANIWELLLVIKYAALMHKILWKEKKHFESEVHQQNAVETFQAFQGEFMEKAADSTLLPISAI